MAEKALPPRLLEASRALSRRERQIIDILGLKIRPRLSLLDESSATYVTGLDRERLEGEADRDDAESKRGEREIAHRAARR